MHRIDVQSSNVASIGYDFDERVMEVEFRSGAVYQYLNVPPDKVLGALLAPSVGSYLAKHIKGAYMFVRLADEPAEPECVEPRD